MNNILSFIKQYKLIVGIAAVLFLIVFVGWGVDWWENKQKLVRAGFARPAFPFQEYTLEELDALYPEYPQANIPDRQTPEQTLALFIQALKDGNIEGALEQMTDNGGKQWSPILDDAKNKGLLGDIISNLSEVRIGTHSATLAHYYYTYTNKNGEKLRQTMIFLKDINGDWLIDSL